MGKIRKTCAARQQRIYPRRSQRSVVQISDTKVMRNSFIIPVNVAYIGVLIYICLLVNFLGLSFEPIPLEFHLRVATSAYEKFTQYLHRIIAHLNAVLTPVLNAVWECGPGWFQIDSQFTPTLSHLN